MNIKNLFENICINEQRITEEFMELVSIDSLSFRERLMADKLTEILTELGLQVKEDNAGAYYNGNAGNIYAFWQGDLEGDPILFSAHMDTVQPGIGKIPVLHEDGRITSKGNTILGADNVAGIVIILEAIRVIKENKIPHRSVEVVFPIGEELFIKGTDVLDYSQIRSKDCYVLDMSGDVGRAAYKAPSIIDFEVIMHGKAAHAGFAPEKGVNAIAAMCQAISQIKQGHVDEDSTLNIGCIEGGNGINIVSEVCKIKGEIRSYKHEKALELIDGAKEKFEETAAEFSAECEFNYNVDLYAYNTPKYAPVVTHFKNVCKDIGIEPVLTTTFGGSDNNNFVRFGLNGLVLSCGMYNIHSTEEYTYVGEMVKGAKLVMGLILKDK